MGWFQKDKNEKNGADGTAAAVSPLGGSGMQGEDGNSLCRSRLHQLLNPETGTARGVAMKLHLEHFKRLNEILGYDYCQELLAQIISYLEQETGCPVYRSIGVEFFIFLTDTSVSQATELVEDILAHFDHVWTVNGTDCFCPVQIGLCPYPTYTDSADEMMKFLDMALSAAAEAGPNQYELYDSQMQADFLRRQAIAKHLQQAIEKQEIEVRYRPTYNVETKKFSRAEYYMRIFIPGLGLVGASEFLPIAEDSGQVRAVEYYALDQAGACIRRLLNEGKEFDSIALPVSSVLFLQEDFTEHIAKLMETYQIPEGKLAVEVQEDVFTMGHLNAYSTLESLADMGVELILNNFGSGLSSISGILNLSVHTLKMDRMFIWQLETNPKAAPVIKGLVHMAKELGLNIIAEGVETAGQLAVLKDAGCTFQQGFYYAPTLEEDTLAEILGMDLETSLPVIEREKQKMKQGRI